MKTLKEYHINYVWHFISTGGGGVQKICINAHSRFCINYK